MNLFNKVVASTLLIAGTVLTPTVAFADDQSPTVLLNGTQMNFPTQPYIENDYTLVPFRAIFEALGYSISWDDATQTVTATKDGLTIQMQIGSVNALVNGSEKIMQIAPELKSDHTFVPLRFVSEASGAKVDWNGATATVNITVNVYVNVGNNNSNTGSNILSGNSVASNVYNGGGNSRLNKVSKDIVSNGQKVYSPDLSSENGVTYISLAPLVASLGLNGNNTSIDSATNTITVNDPKHTLIISQQNITIDGKIVSSLGAIIYQEKFYIPFQAVAQALGWTYSETSNEIDLTNSSVGQSVYK